MQPPLASSEVALYVTNRTFYVLIKPDNLTCYQHKMAYRFTCSRPIMISQAPGARAGSNSAARFSAFGARTVKTVAMPRGAYGENSMQPKRIVVTGGAGFLGSHLCDRLLESGAEVICLDNFFTGSKSNVAHLLSNPRFEIVRHDVVHPILLEVDQIYNFACPASPVHYQYNPVKTVKTNVMGAINMLGLAKRVRARILQASTSEVYGDPKEHPQKESYWGHVNPIGPRSCYDEGKRVAETLMMDYHRQNGVDIRIVRIFNTYGPRMAVE